MANIQTLNLLVNEAGVVVNAPTAIDLNCILGVEEKAKQISQVYIQITGSNVSESTQALQGFTLATKIINICNGKVSYVSDSYEDVAALVVSPCEPCLVKPLGADCSNPMIVEICNTAPPAPVITHDVEYVPNEATGFLDKVTYTWIDGVLQPTVTVPTTYTTETKPKDVEVSTVCNTTTGFYNVIERVYKVDGTLESTNTIATTIGCLEPTPTAPNLTETPRWYTGNNGRFLGYIIADNFGNPINVVTLEGFAPSSFNTIASSNYYYSFTATTTSGQNLRDFIANNDPNGIFKDNKVLSLAIFVDDAVNDLSFDNRGFSKTILKADSGRSMSWGSSNDYSVTEKLFDEFTFQSDTLITINWEQGEI